MEEQDLILLKKFMEKIWPGYRNNVYRALYSTYHPSTYNEGFSNPMDNMMVATDEIDVAITKGENYGLIDKLTGYKFPDSPEFYIDEGTNSHRHPWMVSTLLFNVLWDIVEEFRCYCGEGGVDPDCKGKCIGDFPYLYEDYNNLHDYMEELQDLGAPLDILLDEYPLQLNKIQLSPDYPYRPHEHGHGMRLTEDIDKFLSRRLSVIRENIYTLSDGDLLGESEQHKLENQMCELFNIHKHKASEHLFKWSIKDIISEIAPSPGETSDEGMDTTNLTPVSKKKMTLEEILEEIDDIAYYEDVVVDLEKGDKSWDVTKQVLKYSDYWIKNPNSLTSPDFPPINVIIPNKLNDGSHRISTLYALANHIDSDNPYWNEVKLPVHFYDPKDVITEHEEPGLSPELEIGDVIKVVDIDREVENNSIKYNIAPPELRPEKFTPYAVVDKESNGSASKYPFRYTLVPEDKLEDYEKSLDRGYGDYETYEKLLFPWVHQWIYADTPMANKVDRLTLTEWEGEHEPIIQKERNPELEKGDHVKIISIDGEHANMPKKWEVYVVNSVHGDKYQNQRHYGLYPTYQTDEQLTSSMLAGGGKQRELYLYRGDEWMKVEKESPLIKKLDGMEVEIDTVKYDLGWVDEDTGDATGNQFFEISNPRFAPISYGGDSPIRKDLFKYDLIFREEESGVLERFFTREELERMLNQQGIKDKLEKAIYENYLKLYGMRKPYIKLETVFADDDTDKVLSENILDTFKVISKLNESVVSN